MMDVEREYTLLLKRMGHKKIALIKEIRRHLHCGLKEAKEVVDNIPSQLGPFPEPVARAFFEAIQDLAEVELRATSPQRAPEVSPSIVKMLKLAPQRKIQVIKAVREATGEGLAVTKRLVESPPPVMIEARSLKDAARLAATLEALGCEIERSTPTPEEDASDANMDARLLLKSYPVRKKIQVIKALREVTLGLMEAKQLSERLPAEIEGGDQAQREALYEALKALGAQVEWVGAEGDEGDGASFSLIRGEADPFQLSEILCRQLGLTFDEARRLLDGSAPRIGPMSPEIAETLVAALRRVGADVKP